ncbi:MAG: MBL fold metallo-hydrolase [Chloroflexi bacterium]|nr:MBL fold metallo-hydrolase [Chloroflexota bacterium]
MNTSTTLFDNLHWLGHASFRLDGPPTIYFDPWKLKDGSPQADIILITHEHGDHCSPEDVKKISGPETVIVTIAQAAKELQGDVRVLQPRKELTVGAVKIETVPAYNINKFRSPDNPFHPKEAGHVGYIVTVSGERVYFAGDTDHIPDMAGFNCDVALLPVGGTYTMDAEEAAQAASDIRPKVAVPMHWGAGVVGERTDAERFRSQYDGDVVLLEVE